MRDKFDDWTSRALERFSDCVNIDQYPRVETLHCNRWIASSVLQKAIRRSHVGIACRAALTLHKQDRANVWRRLIAIAFEDVGPADIDVVLQTVAAAVSPGWRASCGEDRAVVSIVSRRFFLDACHRRGHEQALAMIPAGALRQRYEKALQSAHTKFWKPQVIWAAWDDALLNSGLLQ